MKLVVVVVMKELAVIPDKPGVEADVEFPRLAVRLRVSRVPEWTKVQDTAEVLPVVLEGG